MFRFIVLFLFSAMLLVSCNEEEPISEPLQNGPLKNVKSYLNGENWLDFNLYYTDNNLIHKIDYQYSDYINFSLEVLYENDQPQKIIHDINYLDPSREDHKITYDIIFDQNEIVITPDRIGNIKIIKTTNGYVDSGRTYYGDNNEFYVEEIFNRNSDNNIENSIVYDTDQVTGELKQAWKQDFSNFENNTSFKSAFNPVFDLQLTDFYRILNLKISNDNPSHCSRRYGDGHLIEDYNVVQFNYNSIQKVDRILLEYSDNTYEFSYVYYE